MNRLLVNETAFNGIVTTERLIVVSGGGMSGEELEKLKKTHCLPNICSHADECIGPRLEPGSGNIEVHFYHSVPVQHVGEKITVNPPHCPLMEALLCNSKPIR